MSVWLWAASLAFAGPFEDGVSALQAGRASDALSALQQAVDEAPQHAGAWWELGWAKWNVSDLAGAQRAWERVAELEPAFPDLSMWLSAARARASYRAFGEVFPPVPPEPEGKRIRFVAGGDTMMGSDLRRGPAGLPPGDGETLFDAVRELLVGADVAFLNLEGALADDLPSTKCSSSGSCYAFRTPTRFAGTLSRAGLDLASLANNHAMDVGLAGQEATMAALDKAGIAHAGRYGDVAFIERDGVKVALVAAHSGACCLNVNHIDEVKGAVALADKQADIVVFSFHGGAEGSRARHVPGQVEVAWGEKRGDVKALARAAVDAGADLVIGHGPHVLRAMEVYRGRLIAYSLGNFIGYQQFSTAGYSGRSVLVEAELAANGVLVAARLHPLALDGNAVPARDPAGEGLTHVRELSADDFPETGVGVGEDGKLTWRAPTQ